MSTKKSYLRPDFSSYEVAWGGGGGVGVDGVMYFSFEGLQGITAVNCSFTEQR